MAKLSKFGAAFKAARDAGKATFTFGGKAYTTKLKGGDPNSPTTPVPTPAPVKCSPVQRSNNTTDRDLADSKQIADIAAKNRKAGKPTKWITGGGF